MASADFEFMTLRNLTAYQPDGTRVMSNYMMITSTNGGAFFTDNITISSIHTSSFTASSILASSISTNLLSASTVNASTILTNFLNASIELASTIIVSSIFPDTIYDNTNSGGAAGQILTAGAGNTLLWVNSSGVANVEYVSSGRNIDVDNTNYQFPIINLNSSIALSTIVTSTISSLSILDKNGGVGAGGQVLTSDGGGKFIWAAGGGGGGGIVNSVVPGSNITVDSTISAANPIVNLNSTIAVSSMSVSTISTSTIVSNAPDGVILLKPTGTGTINIAGPLDMQNNVIFNINGLTGAAGNIDFTDSLTLKINGNIPNNDVLFNRINNVIVPSTIIASTINTSSISSITILDTTGSPGSLGQLLVSGGNNVKWSTIAGGGGTVLPNGAFLNDYLTWDGAAWVSSNGTDIRFGNNTSTSLSGYAIAIGPGAGKFSQNLNTVAIGNNAGNYFQSASAVAIGQNAGYASQSASAVAIGDQAGNNAQQAYSIAIGRQAGYNNQSTNTIILNASGSALNSQQSSALYINPIRNEPTNTGIVLQYNTGTSEITYTTLSGALPNGTNYSDYLFWNSTTSAWSVGSSTIHIGSFAGQAGQGDGGIVIGNQIYTPGINGIQSTNAIALGTQAGFSNNPVAQADGAIAIGYYAGSDNSGGYQESNSIAIGTNAGIYGQSTFSIAIGYNAGGGGGGGGTNPQGINSIAIGTNAGSGTSLGTNSIAIGYLSGVGAQGIESTIVINASGQPLTPSPISGGGLFIQPIRYGASGAPFSTLQYSPFSGEVTYTGKTFVINHPNNSDRYLVHACLEGPEDGIYYRGKGEITSHSNYTIVTLPDYVDALGTDFTVQITPIFNGAVLSYAASEITNGSFTVHGQPGRFFWLVHGKRSTFNVEPLKTSAHLVGNGPYKWLEYTKSV